MKLLLINVMTIIGVTCIINLTAFNFEPFFVFINATYEKGNMQKTCKDLQVQLSRQKLQEVNSFDTTGNRVTLVLFVYDDMTYERCEELLCAMVQNRDYCSIHYCIIY